MVRTRPLLSMTIALLISPALAACLVGDEADLEDDPVGAIGASSNPGDRLRWASLSSSCASGNSGIVGNGPALSVFFDNGTRWTQCTFTGVLRVPADVRVTGLRQQVRTEGTVAPIRYSARFNGSQITAKTTTSRDTLDASANLASYGDALCRKAGKGVREIPISFVAIVDGSGVSLDSVDWELAARDCK